MTGSGNNYIFLHCHRTNPKQANTPKHKHAA